MVIGTCQREDLTPILTLVSAFGLVSPPRRAPFERSLRLERALGGEVAAGQSGLRRGLGTGGLERVLDPTTRQRA